VQSLTCEDLLIKLDIPNNLSLCICVFTCLDQLVFETTLLDTKHVIVSATEQANRVSIYLVKIRFGKTKENIISLRLPVWKISY
jgi:hypothetical protein